MSASREMLEAQSERYADKLREINSYITELKAKTAEHGTDGSSYEDDLLEAEHNVKYYEGEIARIKGALGEAQEPAHAPTASGGQTVSDAPAGAAAMLPRAVRQGVGSLILTTLAFAAGTLLGSRLSSRGGGGGGAEGKGGN